MLAKTITIIGGGNMGSALLRGILRAELVPPERISVVDIHPQKIEQLRAQFGVRAISDARAAVRDADVILLAVKPRTLNDVLDAIRDETRPGHVFISIIAGVETAYICERLGKGNPVVRVMPNIAATVDAAASAISAGRHATEEHMALAEAIFGAVGDVVRVDEEHLDAVTGLSGSGPAYIYMVVEALSDGGVKMGLPREIALKLAVQTVLGAAKLVKETGLHPATLRDQVTTPGGTTISAVHELEERGLRAMLISAVVTATEKSRELNALARRRP
ncbi:MAG: pyrroline-5-carboxylate reductase [Planctomycetota bacterium]